MIPLITMQKEGDTKISISQMFTHFKSPTISYKAIILQALFITAITLTVAT